MISEVSFSAVMVILMNFMMMCFLAGPLIKRPFLTLCPSEEHKYLDTVKFNVLKALISSLISLALFLAQKKDTVLFVVQGIHTSFIDLNFSLKFDMYSVLFIPIALFITLSILKYTSWYLSEDHKKPRFFMLLLLFLMFMIILVTANNMFLLFIGWEGVGIMSFLLIGWWSGRPDANTAALQALLYNRIGDIGLLFAMGWMASYLNTWELDAILATPKEIDLTFPLMGLVLAAAGKSAQFGLHPWLPSAMEGPTPVSALLHSSTMVVAGIFLMVRFSPLAANNTTVLSACLWLGALTTLHAAACALKQNDFKKVIAFSTSSQLGLMMVSIGLAKPELAFLHVCMHALFKSMLFLCSGFIIHILGDEQDLRKMGGMLKTAPVATSCFLVGSLALAGFPYLAGFYSKDAIIEAATLSHSNAWALGLTILATAFTAVYSIRVIFMLSMGNTRVNKTHLATEPGSGPDSEATHTIVGLAFASIVGGFVLMNYIVPSSTCTMTMPIMYKTVALIISTIGLLIGKEVAYHTSRPDSKTSINSQQKFFTLLAYFPSVMHFLGPNGYLSFAQKVASMAAELGLEKKIPKKVPTTPSKWTTHPMKILLTTNFVILVMTIIFVLALFL